jgi:pyruvate carboxylase
VRKDYAGFESDLRFGASEVYLHEMPGGQFTNLKEQARALGLEERWHDVAATYAQVNQMFGDIVKVTPSSKVVGDMALSMVSAGLSRAQVEDPNREVAFPESVVSLFHGDLGQPPGGFPKALQDKVLKGQKPITVRPGAAVPPADLAQVKAEAEQKVGRAISQEELQSYLMYPKVFVDYAQHRAIYGPVEALPTPVFFYGLQPGQEITVELEPGKTMNIRCVAIGEVDDEGQVKVFFELNGQPRAVRVKDKGAAAQVASHPKAEPGNINHVPAPMPGVVASVAVHEGQKVTAGDLLLTIEAMKMETAIHTDKDATIKRLTVQPGTQVDAKDLLVEFG